ncbi:MULTISPECIES: 50S ribosomal protein L29 [Cyanophyceae]|uniref:Large ribosomal subunit protein uL29 n=1 Tax=Pseudocalidococcus azoricus BACA0444 TaxID=2918990 RepID=A0AAE4JVV7_9CYAN|nr:MULTISPECIES: 50S ribosomal protein L29 [Cyanophyceae]AFY62231.1 LSU ribosomal protein L29P [Synechococcus sp. PCC 6312]MDS3859468.1 50S ribosomal protein L29 [Pseudocalidococcus azoricus BACA0444]
MALTKMSEFVDLSDQSLDEKIAEIKKQLFDLRFAQATRREVKPHQYKHLRHTLAQLMTLERQRQLGITHSSTGEG